ncbi:translation initiation factor IF-3, mitochondrial [Homalodisca vitripennis]|uniref:translation initiation factor IF-3, mitochondrial n=1 Tax=Homalodisca vitripennis TaxID=197043 RepID=UPI001EEA151F|nr:translation initiation factor IF-3, mitochondrial [Homalodisca vitripennis]
MWSRLSFKVYSLTIKGYPTTYICEKTSASLLRISQERLTPSLSLFVSKYGKAFYSFDSKDNVNKTTLEKGPSSNKPKKPKKELKTYITLLDLDKKMSVTTVEDAAKLALRRNYKLVKVVDFDPKTDRAVYQLLTESQYLKDDKGWEETKTKSEKSITDSKVVSFSTNINEHDVLTKINMMKKWLSKKYEVRVVVTGDLKAGENIYKLIEQNIGVDGRIVQKRTKGSDVRFQILPPKKTEKSSKVSETETT